MDSMQFGQWMHERRRKYGFSSQRLLAERAQQDPVLAASGVSEAFLARLETGQLAHPFRGSVRQRVLALAGLLCKTPKEVQAYLRAAEVTELDTAEQEQIASLCQRLSPLVATGTISLPPRPARLFGRQEVAQRLAKRLVDLESGVALITGMPGVGKSALAAEVLHHLASDEQMLAQAFSDGIISFSCAGYRGQAGLMALCEHILALVGAQAGGSRPGPARHQRSTTLAARKEQRVACASKPAADADLTSAISRVRRALACRSLLILLDDLDAQFPLRQALTALLSESGQTGTSRQERHSRRVVLATSRFQFSPAIITYQLRLEPLAPEDALAYFLSLIDHPCDEETVQLARACCASVGYLPLAIEGLAASARAGMPLALLNASTAGHDLLATLESEPEVFGRFEQALEDLNPSIRQRFALLSLLGNASFGLEAATATQRALSFAPDSFSLALRPPSASTHLFPEQAVGDLARTALELGQLVRHSVLDLLPLEASIPLLVGQNLFSHTPAETMRGEASLDVFSERVPRQPRYRLHPVLRAYSLRQREALTPEELDHARRNLRAYSLDYLEQHQDDIPALLRERDVLFAAFTQAVQEAAHATIARFVDGMAPISCRLARPEDGDWLFQWGIQACQSLHDRPQQARFMHSFGWLCCQRGKFTSARQCWEEALDLARTLPAPFWQPLLGLAHLAYMQNEKAAAIRAVEAFLRHAEQSASPLEVFAAKVRLAQYQRLQGAEERAYATLMAATSLLDSDQQLSTHPATTLPALQAQLELARLQGDYAATQQGVEVAAAYLQDIGEPYALAQTLLEQALFAAQSDQWSDVPDLAQRIVLASEEVDAAFMRQRGLHLAQQAEERSSAVALARPFSLALG